MAKLLGLSTMEDAHVRALRLLVLRYAADRNLDGAFLVKMCVELLAVTAATQDLHGSGTGGLDPYLTRVVADVRDRYGEVVRGLVAARLG